MSDHHTSSDQFDFTLRRKKLIVSQNIPSNQMSSNNKAIAGYKAALRATRIAFRNDDHVLKSARDKIRAGFEENRHLQNSEKVNEELDKLAEVSKFLVRNIVQAVRQDDSDKYLLNFHDQIELGDNDTIKKNSRVDLGSLAGAKVKKCS